MKKPSKVEKVMREYGKGELHSGSKKGPVVTNQKQAVAIAMSEAGKSKKEKEMKNLIYSDEVRNKVRKDMADLYRKIRRDNPAMARLLFKQQKHCVDKLSNFIMNDFTTGFGLRGLLND